MHHPSKVSRIGYGGSNPSGCTKKNASIVQGSEREFPKFQIQVRILLGVLNAFVVQGLERLVSTQVVWGFESLRGY